MASGLRGRGRFLLMCGGGVAPPNDALFSGSGGLGGMWCYEIG